MVWLAAGHGLLDYHGLQVLALRSLLFDDLNDRSEVRVILDNEAMSAVLPRATVTDYWEEAQAGKGCQLTPSSVVHSGLGSS